MLLGPPYIPNAAGFFRTTPCSRSGRKRNHSEGYAKRGVFALWMLLAGVLAGCRPSTAPEAPATRPAHPGREKSLLSLDQLRPVIEPPLATRQSEELPNELSAIVANAEELLKAERFSEALAELSNVAGSADEYHRIARVIALSLANTPDRAKAIEALERAVNLSQDDLEVQLALARLYSAGKQDNSAILTLRKALVCSQATEENPLAGEALLRLGELLSEHGYYTAAAQCMEQLAQRLDRHRHGLVENRWLRPLVLRPEKLLAARSLLLMKLKRFRESAGLLERAFHYDRSSRNSARMLIDALVAARAFGKAETIVVEIAGQPSQRPQLKKLIENLCVAESDPAAARRIADALRTHQRLDVELTLHLSGIARKLNADDEARNILESSLKAHPGNGEIARDLADLYAAEGKHRKALMLLAQVISDNDQSAQTVRDAMKKIVAHPTPVDIERSFAQEITRLELPSGLDIAGLHYVAGCLAEARGDDILSADQYEKAITAQPNHNPAYEALVDIYLKTDRRLYIDRLIRRIESTAPQTYFTDYLRGKVQFHRGRLTEAVEHLKRSYSQDKNHLPTLMLLGQSLSRLGLHRKATAILSDAVRLAPDREAIYEALFDTYMDSGQYRHAVHVAGRVLRRNPDSVTGKILQAELALRTGRITTAQEILRKLRSARADSGRIDLLELQVLLSESSGALPDEQFRAAAARLVELVTRDPFDLRPKRALGRLLGRQGEQGDSEAVRIWGELYERMNQIRDVAKAYALSLYRTERHAEAMKVFQKLLDEEPRDLRTQQLLLQTLKKLGDKDALTEACTNAQKVLDEWIASTTDQSVAASLRNEKLDLYILGELYDGYVEFAEQWIQSDPTNLALRELVAQRLVQADRADLAHKMLDEWIESEDPGAETYRQMKMATYVQTGQLEEAREFALQWAREHPESTDPRSVVLSLLLGSKQYEEAQKLLDTWANEPSETTTQPDTPERNEVAVWSRKQAVRLLIVRGKCEQGLERAETYISLDPDNHELHSLRSSCLTELGRSEDAIAAMETAHSLKPDATEVNNNLGYIYTDAGIHLDRAERMIRIALSENPREVSYQDSLAWVFYKEGRFAEAARIFQRILGAPTRVRPDHPIIYDHAGDTMWRLGRKQIALKYWKAAVDLAEKTELKFAEIKKVLSHAAEKIEAAKSDSPPPVAPLGEGYEDDGNSDQGGKSNHH